MTPLIIVLNTQPSLSLDREFGNDAPLPVEFENPEDQLGEADYLKRSAAHKRPPQSNTGAN